MPTTYHIATVAGFLAGGSGGLGSVTYGRTWDGNFSSVELLTAEDPPQARRLDGDGLRMVMHTYGTVGIVTRVRLPLIAAHAWQGWYATFPDFDACFEFGWDVADDPTVQKRLVSVHEAPLPSMFEPFKRLFTTNDRVEALNQMHQLQTRFPRKFVNHIEFVRIPEGLNPSGLPAVFTSDPREIDAMINFCAEIGVGVANPHSYVVKEGGMVKDIASIVAFKHETDPYGLLNPGKLDGSFYAQAVKG